MSPRQKMILNVCAVVGIVGGIIARRMSGMDGMLVGAAYGAGGALVGVIVGVVIHSLLPKEPDQP